MKTQGVTTNHPFNNQIKPADQAKAKDVVSMLKSYNGQLSGQVDEMEKKVKELEAKIKAAYAIKEMQKMPYDLHSICVHDGNATSGHYYTFIFDHCQKKWRKYNDIKVTEVSEEDVFKESLGGNSWKTAYWLVYMQQSITDIIKKEDINKYSVPANPLGPTNCSNSYYGDKIPNEIKKQIEQENQKQAEEIIKIENQKIITSISKLVRT